MALADGGFQVGELAKLYFPEGVEVVAVDPSEALKETERLMKELDDVTIFEAAISFKNYLVRVDILRRDKNVIELFEVKAKSWTQKRSISKKNGLPRSIWAPYINDIAMQHWVVENAFPTT